MLKPRIFHALALSAIYTVAWQSSAIAQNVELDCTDATPIYEIQGAGHVSPMVDQAVATCGVVTAVAFAGYYLQDVAGDGDVATSDAVYVAQRSDKPAVGTQVMLTGTVSEIIGGGAATGNLSTTTLTGTLIQSSVAEHPLPAPVLIGQDGRQPPQSAVITQSETQPAINLQLASDDLANNFNPSVDSIDFHESLEGMLVSVPDAFAVSAIRQFGQFSAEVFVVTERDQASGFQERMTVNGGVLLPADRDNLSDQNANRLQVQFDGTLFGSTQYPAVSVGDSLVGVQGVVSYSFGNFEILQLGPLQVASGGNVPLPSTMEPIEGALSVASYNVLNLSAVAGDDDQRALIAQQIVYSLDSPAIVALQEVQDDNGDISDCPQDAPEACASELGARLTLEKLAQEIVVAGGPQYDFIVANPLVETTDDNRENPDIFGGASLGNIRNAFLFDANRVELIDSRLLDRNVLNSAGVSVPNAFDGSRDPLEGVFLYNDQRVRIINNHFSSRFGSSPIFGGFQPFIQAGEEQRAAQSRTLHQVVAGQLAAAPNEAIIVLGDLNTFEFTDELAEVLPAASGSEILVNLHASDAKASAYSYNFEGNSQALDHIFVSNNIASGSRAQYVHVNVDFPRLSTSVVASDHDPVLASISFSEPELLGLRGEIYGLKALEIFWNRIPGAISYIIYRDGELLMESVGLSLFESALTGDVYNYEVVALNSAGQPFVRSSIDLRLRERTPTGPMGPVLTELTGTVYSSSAVEIFWTFSDDRHLDVDGFNVMRNGAVVYRGDGHSFFDDNLATSTEYVYEVQAFNENGVLGDALQVVLVTRPGGGQVPDSGLPQVESLTGLVYSSSALEIFWQPPVTDVAIASYEVFRNGELIDSKDARSEFESDLTAGTDFVYGVRAVDVNGEVGALRELELTTRVD